MSDLKRECPGCHSYTSGVGQAIEEGTPCPYCGYDLQALPTREQRNQDAQMGMTPEAAWRLWLAWNDGGTHPEYHRRRQNELRSTWPVLAAALDQMKRPAR